MLKITSLTSGYGGLEVLKDINLQLSKGMVTAVLGPNGSGKSTLLKTIVRVLKAKKGVIYLGETKLNRLSSRIIAQRFAYLPQTAAAVHFCTVFEAVLLGRKPYIVFEPGEKDLDTVTKIIKDFGIAHFAFKKVNELSGGELQKVMIARALAQQPEVLLLDEPVNHLDPKNQQDILTILKTVTKKFDLINLIVLHDLNIALQFADYFVFMKNGKVYYEGDYSIICPEIIKTVYEIEVEMAEINGRKVIIPG